MAAKKSNPWIEHLMKVRSQKGNKDKSLKDVIKEAKKTYKKK
jgi:hypothetical protein